MTCASSLIMRTRIAFLFELAYIMMGNNRQIRITYSSHTHPTLTMHAPKTTYPPAQPATKPPTPTRLRAQKPFITLTISSCSRQQYNLNFQVWSYMEYCTYCCPSSSIVEMGSAADWLIDVINGKMNVCILRGVLIRRGFLA